MSITLDEFSWELDLSDELKGLSSSEKSQVKQEIGDFLVKKINQQTQAQRSPVDGQAFQPLSKDYKKRKIKQGKGGKANLILNSDMMPSLKAVTTSSGVKLEINKSSEIPKAFNHNTGDTIPQRQFLPDEDLGELFTDDIMQGVVKILKRSVDVEDVFETSDPDAQQTTEGDSIVDIILSQSGSEEAVFLELIKRNNLFNGS